MSYFLYSDSVATINIKNYIAKVNKQNFFVRGLHSVVDKDCNLLGYDALSIGSLLLTF